MASWLVDKMLPNFVAAALWAPAALLIQHRATVRKFRKVTDKQTTELKAHFSGTTDDGSPTP